jgi:hypothetical protein
MRDLPVWRAGSTPEARVTGRPDWRGVTTTSTQPADANPTWTGMSFWVL